MTLQEFKNLNLEELYKYTKEKLEYGWVDTKGKKHYGSNNNDLEYHLQKPEETIERNIAICWDKTELLRYYFESNNYEDIKTYLIYLYITDDYCPSHSIITYKKNNQYIWFETSQGMGGIRKYKKEEELLKDLKRLFIEDLIVNDMVDKDNDFSKLVCYQYKKPSFSIRGSAFYNHARTGKKVI